MFIAILSIMSQLIYLHELIPPFVDLCMSIGTVVQLILLTQNMRILMYFSKRYMAEGIELDQTLFSYKLWVEAEILLRVGIMFSCFIYMFVRKFTRERFDFNV